MAVTEHGTEVGWDDEGVEEPAGEPPYTPNSVSEVRRSSKGPWIDIDCKSEIPPPMRDAFIRIIVEELTEAGVKAAKLESPPREERGRDQPHPSEVAAEPRGTPPRLRSPPLHAISSFEASPTDPSERQFPISRTQCSAARLSDPLGTEAVS